MKANEMLLKCMKCKNNIECWGINLAIQPHDTDPTSIKISVDAVCKNLKRLDPKNINDFMAYAILMYVRTTINEIEKGKENNILHTSMCLLEGLAGSTKLTWDCPDAFEYTPIDEV